MYCGFSKQLIPSLVCQKDSCKLGILSETEGDADVIYNGILYCPECNVQINIQDGILDLISGGEKLDSVLQSEIGTRDGSADAYDAKLAPRFDKEIPSTLKEIGNISGKMIIEYGCGTGRLTTEMLSCEALLATDFSLSSLHVLSKKLAGRKNIGLMLANSITLKTAEEFFDITVSAQVYEHIPTRAQRNEFLKNVKNTLQPGGKFVASMYHQDLRRRLQKKLQEGYHSSKIFFHYFSREEIRNEFSQVFIIKHLKNIDITLPLEVRFNLTRYFKGGVSRFFESVPFVRLFGHLILITVVKDRAAISPQNRTHYGYGFVSPHFFRKEWFWFVNPHERSGVAMVNFFSYDNIDIGGFHKKEALTTVIDVDQGLETIWENMRKDFIRKQISKGERSGIVVKRDQNFREFKKIHTYFRKQKKLPKDNYKMLEQNGILFSAYYHDEMIAGGVFISDGIHMRAWVLSSKRHDGSGMMRERIGQANRMIIWGGVKYAKESGHKVFDLGGIDPESKNPEKASLSQFKEGFGGERRKCYYYYKIYSQTIKTLLRIRGFTHI